MKQLVKKIPLNPPFAKGEALEPPFNKGGQRGILITAILLVLLLATLAHGYTGRRAVLYTEVLVKLEINEPYKRGSADCSKQMWDLLSKVFPELRTMKWFRRTTADAMAAWPWESLLSLKNLTFGDLLFGNGDEDDPQERSPEEEFRISHVMMSWTRPDRAVHAGKRRGFSETSLDPYWRPRINLAIRPPY